VKENVIVSQDVIFDERNTGTPEASQTPSPIMYDTIQVQQEPTVSSIEHDEVSEPEVPIHEGRESAQSRQSSEETTQRRSA
jgi:hypothetical protein